MEIDFDKFYADYKAFKTEVKAFETKVNDFIAASATAAAKAPTPIMIQAPVPEDKQVAKGYIEAGNLDAAGAAAGVTRISLKTGHPFDETDDSYRRRILTAVVGAGSVDAVEAAIVQGQPEAPAAATPAKTPSISSTPVAGPATFTPSPVGGSLIVPAPTPPIPPDEPAPGPILPSVPVAPIEPIVAPEAPVVAPVPPVVASSPTA